MIKYGIEKGCCCSNRLLCKNKGYVKCISIRSINLKIRDMLIQIKCMWIRSINLVELYMQFFYHWKTWIYNVCFSILTSIFVFQFWLLYLYFVLIYLCIILCLFTIILKVDIATSNFNCTPYAHILVDVDTFIYTHPQATKHIEGRLQIFMTINDTISSNSSF